MESIRLTGKLPHRFMQGAVVLFVAAVVALVITPTALANTGANTLKVSPVRSDIEIKPGESRVVPVTVSNLTKEPIVVSPVINDFISGDERGTPALILDEDSFAPSRSLKRFIEPLAEVTIPANEAKTINVAISVPGNARAGGYFGAVRFAPAAPDDGGQVNLSASVASLVLLTVPGEVTEKLELTDFEVQQNGQTSWLFTDASDLQSTIRFASDSGVQLGPIGKLSVTKGGEVVYEADFNDNNPRDMILPDSARRWDVPLSDIGSLGHYTLSATFTYGQKNQTIEATTSFWVVPVWAIAAAAAGILALIGLIIGVVLYARRRRRQSYGRRSSRGGSGLRL